LGRGGGSSGGIGGFGSKSAKFLWATQEGAEK